MPGLAAIEYPLRDNLVRIWPILVTAGDIMQSDEL